MGWIGYINVISMLSRNVSGIGQLSLSQDEHRSVELGALVTRSSTRSVQGQQSAGLSHTMRQCTQGAHHHTIRAPLCNKLVPLLGAAIAYTGSVITPTVRILAEDMAADGTCSLDKAVAALRDSWSLYDKGVLLLNSNPLGHNGEGAIGSGLVHEAQVRVAAAVFSLILNSNPSHKVTLLCIGSDASAIGSLVKAAGRGTRQFKLD
jgi:hypothetical protein